MSQSEHSNLPPEQMTAHSGSGGVLATAAAYGFALPGACRWCSSPYSVTVHSGPCPRVKAIEYHPDGSVKRVEFREEGAEALRVASAYSEPRPAPLARPDEPTVRQPLRGQKR